jgi:hypothetical protein
MTRQRTLPAGTDPLVAQLIADVDWLEARMGSGRRATNQAVHRIDETSRDILAAIDRIPRPQLDVIGERLGWVQRRTGRVPPRAQQLRDECHLRLGVPQAEGEGGHDRNGPVLDAMLDVALAAARNPRLIQQRRLVR